MSHEVKKRGLAAGLLLVASLAMAGNGLAQPSACERLAERARQLPDAAWAKPGPLSAWFRPSPPNSSRLPSATERALLADPQWSGELRHNGMSAVFADRLQGTDVYLLASFAGTAGCQSVRLLRAPVGQKPQQVALPPWLIDGEGELCTTRRAFFATVLGQPMLVAGGHLGMDSLDQTYRMAPWTGRSWGEPCTLSLSLRRRLTLAETHCAPGAAICEVGRSLALKLAGGYETDRDGGRLLDTESFADDPSIKTDAMTSLDHPPAEPGAAGSESPQVLGDSTPADGFSYVELRRPAVWLNSTWWWAVVGHPGVGWRESPDVLVTLYAPSGHAGDAVASYRVHVDAQGLLEAKTGR